MTGFSSVRVPEWEDVSSRWSAGRLGDRGVRYADKFLLSNGWIYKAIGDRHPEDGVLVVPDWAPVDQAPPGQDGRDGMVKVRDHRWPDGSPPPRMLDLADVPMYLRRYEVATPETIVRHVVPEAAARDAVESHLAVPPVVRRVLEILAELSGDLGRVGLNGSHALGLAREESDIDVDIFGRLAIGAVTGALARRKLPPGWTRRWPPDEQTNLFYVRAAAYPEVGSDRLRSAFQESGREVFNFLVDRTRVSVSYHSRERTERVDEIASSYGDLGPAQVFSATLDVRGAYGRFDLPAVFRVLDVRGERFSAEAATVIADSKAFGFAWPGDEVRFRARAESSGGRAILHMSSYGPEWPVWPVAL